jgi:hypothetical protein
MMVHSGTDRAPSLSRWAFLAAIAVALLAQSVEAQEVSTDPDAAIEAGKDALSSGRGYPWYDSSKDDIRAIKLPKPASTSQNWFNFGGAGEGLGTVLQVIVYVLLAVVLTALVFGLISAFLSRENDQAAAAAAATRPAVTEQARVEALPFKLNKDTGDLLGEAQRSYEQGKYSEAILYLFSYQLLEMDRGQIIRLTKGKTNRQYLREISPRRPLQTLIAQTMVAFEDVFFGNHPLGRERFESCWSQVGQFKSLIQQGAA